MKSDARKELNQVVISVYDKVLKLLENRLRDHNLLPNTVRNYLAEMKPFLAWLVKYTACILTTIPFLKK